MPKLFQIDAFTNRPFAGNPAAVCLLEKPASDKWMQDVATEMNLSETAFLLKEAQGYRLRWFTPLLEVNLCGHATLATAHAVWESGLRPRGEILEFHTLSGMLKARADGDWIELVFPVNPVKPQNLNEDDLRAYGIKAKPMAVNRTTTRLANVIELPTEADVAAVAPDFSAMAARGLEDLIVTARADSKDLDFVSRFFAPSFGIPEDPVTGAAHCALAHYWSQKLGKNEFRAFQSSKRGGFMGVRLEGKDVFLRGQAVTVFETTLRAE